jgi:hypothetical protein
MESFGVLDLSLKDSDLVGGLCNCLLLSTFDGRRYFNILDLNFCDASLM